MKGAIESKMNTYDAEKYYYPPGSHIWVKHKRHGISELVECIVEDSSLHVIVVRELIPYKVEVNDKNYTILRKSDYTISVRKVDLAIGEEIEW